MQERQLQLQIGKEKTYTLWLGKEKYRLFLARRRHGNEKQKALYKSEMSFKHGESRRYDGPSQCYARPFTSPEHPSFYLGLRPSV